MPDRFNGWDPQREQALLPQLRMNSVEPRRWFGNAFDRLRDTIPESLDPQRWHTIEDQGPIGSCQGNAQSTCGEFSHWVQSGGMSIQFSRWFAYRATQIIDGLKSDVGSTITGGARCAKEVGFCPEKDCPYPRSYRDGVPITQSMRDLAARMKMRSTVMMQTYDDCFRWIAGGQGVILIGIMWDKALANCRGVIESYSGRGGGHALALAGYSKRKDSRGRHYLWMPNSHGRDWGNGGYAEVAPVAIEQMLSHRWTVFCGFTDLSGVEPPRPRNIDFTKDSLIG